MPFKKGQSGNPGGRPKDSKNKATEDLRGKIAEFLTTNWNQVQSDYDKMDSERRLLFLEKLLKYSVPPLQSLNVQAAIIRTLDNMTDDQLNDLAEKIITLNSNNDEK
jgi:hypothetical protein